MSCSMCCEISIACRLLRATHSCGALARIRFGRSLQGGVPGRRNSNALPRVIAKIASCWPPR